MMTTEQLAQLAETIGEYAASQSNPCGVVFSVDCGKYTIADKYTITDDWFSEEFSTFEDLLEAAQKWKDCFDEAKVGSVGLG